MELKTMRNSSVDQIILETLVSEHIHLTSHQVYEKIRVRLPAVNPSTIYRALERLAKNGKISVSDMGTGAAVYESLSDKRHHHLVCQQCGQIITIDNEAVCQFFKSLEDNQNFKIVTNHLVLFGLCAECQKTIKD
jgi:Fur family transcriptional regulator, ferric uptake regulator